MAVTRKADPARPTTVFACAVAPYRRASQILAHIAGYRSGLLLQHCTSRASFARDGRGRGQMYDTPTTRQVGSADDRTDRRGPRTSWMYHLTHATIVEWRNHFKRRPSRWQARRAGPRFRP